MESDCVTGGPPFLMDILGRAMGRGIHTKSYLTNDCTLYWIIQTNHYDIESLVAYYMSFIHRSWSS